MFANLRFAAVVLVAVTMAPVYAQTAKEPARELVRDVIYNELHDRERDSHWQYRSECESTANNLVREQVETDQGPVFRILAQDGKPLDAAQQERENERLAAYIHSPGQIARVEREHQEDESRLAQVMELLPQAFLFSIWANRMGTCSRLDFGRSGFCTLRL